MLNKTLQTLFEKVEYARKKRQLKAAFRRKPKPARVRIKDEEGPNTAIKQEGGE